MQEAGRGVLAGVVDGRPVAPPVALDGAEEVDGPVRELGRPLGRHQDHGGGAVVLHAAVEQAVGLGDPAALVVRLGRQRAPVHHRPRVLLGVVVRRQGHRPLGVEAHAALVHEAVHAQGEGLRRRHQAEGTVNAPLPEMVGVWGSAPNR